MHRSVKPGSLVQLQDCPPYPNRGCKFDYLGKLELAEISAMQFLVNISHSKVLMLLPILNLAHKITMVVAELVDASLS